MRHTDIFYTFWDVIRELNFQKMILYNRGNAFYLCHLCMRQFQSGFRTGKLLLWLLRLRNVIYWSSKIQIEWFNHFSRYLSFSSLRFDEFFYFNFDNSTQLLRFDDLFVQQFDRKSGAKIQIVIKSTIMGKMKTH